MGNPNRERALFFHGLVLSAVLLLGAAAEPQEVSFLARRDFDVGGSPYAVAVSDFNRDGVLDVVAANWTGVAVLLGNGGWTWR